MTSALHGKFVWYELASPDVAAGRRFYSEVLGWESRDGQIPGIDYHLLSAKGTDIAGSMPAEDGMPPSWTGYVCVDRIADMAAKAHSFGATTIVPISPIPGVGQFSILLDPAGGCFGLIEYAPDFPNKPETLPDHGVQGNGWWRELHTSGDADTILDFYHQLFGWSETRRMPMPPDSHYLIFGDNADIGGLFKDTSAPASYWLYYFWVDDIDATQAKIENSGGKIVMGPMEVPNSAWVLNVLDPQGVLFAVVGYRGMK